jgi:hypothetical protein
MNKNIPSLGDTATEVLKNALNFDCAGYLLNFDVICEGHWQYNRGTNKFEKVKIIGNVPVIDRVEGDYFDEWLMYNLSMGYVTVYVQGSNYYRELHRATAKRIPIDKE